MSSLFLVVTGGSRGLGQALALAFVKNETSVPISSVRVILVARSEDGLLETEQRIREEAQSSLVSVPVVTHVVDLSQLDKLDDDIENLFQKELASFNSFDRFVLVNNAGSLGHVGSYTTLKSVRDLQQAIDLNVTSCLWLSIRFVQEYQKHKKTWSQDRIDHTTLLVINISSLCAIQSFPTMAVYCAGKAARDMFHATIAQEDGGKNVKFLNYAPGACETDMTTELVESDALDEKLQTFYRSSQAEGTLVKPEDTSRRLVKLVLENDFESGKHIDYWDLADKEQG